MSTAEKSTEDPDIQLQTAVVKTKQQKKMLYEK